MRIRVRRMAALFMGLVTALSVAVAPPAAAAEYLTTRAVRILSPGPATQIEVAARLAQVRFQRLLNSFIHR